MTVSVRDTRDETRDHLESVLAGNRKLASKLADVIHADDDSGVILDNNSTTTTANSAGPAISSSSYSSSAPFSSRDDLLSHATRLSAPIPLQSLGIWIDPIDSTAEYIKGVDGNKFRHHGVVCKGLQSAVVLVGIFDRITGEPIMGVIYQPFGEKRELSAASLSRTKYNESVTTTTTTTSEMDNDGGVSSASHNDADATPRAEECGADGPLFTSARDSNDVDLVSAASDVEQEGGGLGDHNGRSTSDTNLGDDVIDAGVDNNDDDDPSNESTSCWQERYSWGVCYGDIKVHASGGAPLPPLVSSSSPHSSSFSFHSLRGGNGSKGSEDFSSSSSLVPSSSHMNNNINTSQDIKNHSTHSTSSCYDSNGLKVSPISVVGAAVAAPSVNVVVVNPLFKVSR